MTGQHDQSRLVPRASAVEALTQIRALCDEWERRFLPGVPVVGVVKTEDVRAVLDAVPVDATPPHGPDRDALQGVILDHFHAPDERHSSWWINTEEMADAVLALVRPAAGIVLSREEARLLVSTLRRTDEWHAVHLAALAARLEASS